MDTHYFLGIRDPRVVGRCKHKLSDILMAALITYLVGGSDYSDMYHLCLYRGEELKEVLELPNGVPSEDTFERVMQAIDPQALSECLRLYGSELIKSLKGVQVAIDGKKMRGTNPRGKGACSYILSAWVDAYSLSLGQEYVGAKTNELSHVPALLDSLELEGAIVTMDAMGTQRAVAEQIVAKKADYVLGLKHNQPHLAEDVEAAFTSKAHRKRFKNQEKGHGRIDTRTYTVLPFGEHVTASVAASWPSAKSIICVEHKTWRPDQAETHETRYYISSLDYKETTAQSFAQYIRGHWAVENKLHWHLDVTFGEDACRARKKHSAENLNLIRKLALLILKQRKDKLSVKARRWAAFNSAAYLRELLGF